MPAFITRCYCLWLLPVLLSYTGQAQKRMRAAARTDSLVAAQHYLFHAGFIQPMSGAAQPVTGEYYTVLVTNDAVTAFLPYIGVAYVAPLNPQEGVIKFTSHNFSYDRRQRRNGVWEITIKPRDVKDIQRMDLSISPGGHTLLQVIRVTAQPVSFTGVLVL